MIARNNLISIVVLLAGLSAGFFIAKATGGREANSSVGRDNSTSDNLVLQMDSDSLEPSRLLIPFYGFQNLRDLSAFVEKYRITDPAEELDSTQKKQICSYFGTDSLLVSNLSTYLESSFNVMLTGYAGINNLFSDQNSSEEGSRLITWIMEEGVPGANMAELSNIYFRTGDDYQLILDGVFQAVKGVISQKALITEVQGRVTENLADYDWLISKIDYEIELYRLMDLYAQFFMNYFRWIDTGDMQSKSNYQLALGRCIAAMKFHQEKYAGDQEVLKIDFSEVITGLVPPGNASRSIRWARVSVVLVLFLLVMGIPGLLRDRAHQKFSGTLYFDAIFRPYLVSSLTSYHGAGRLALLLLAIYFMALIAFSSFASVLFPVKAGVLGLVPALLLAGLLKKGRNSWEIMVSFIAPLMVLVSVLLFITAIRGPMFFWYHFWISDLFRLLFLSLFFMLLFRLIQVYFVLTRKWGGVKLKSVNAIRRK